MKTYVCTYGNLALKGDELLIHATIHINPEASYETTRYKIPFTGMPRTGKIERRLMAAQGGVGGRAAGEGSERLLLGTVIYLEVYV
jgi:hypothetical protein